MTTDLEVQLTIRDQFSQALTRFNSQLNVTGTALKHLQTVTGVAKDTFGFLKEKMGEPINAASDLNESISKVNVVFGESAPKMQAFAATAAQSMGMSSQSALEATGTFGNLLGSMGLSKEVGGDMSMAMVKLAGDLASFNNINPDEALLKLRAGITGEAEPLKALGVNLNAAAIEMQALADTGKASKDELTAGEKATASYNLILAQTTTAQGDFTRTSSGLANQQRITTAQTKDAQAALGQNFLPGIEAVTQAINTLFIPAVAGGSTVMGGIGEVFNTVAVFVADFIKKVSSIAVESNLNVFDALVAAIRQTLMDTFGPDATLLFDIFTGAIGLIVTAVELLLPVLGFLLGALLDVLVALKDAVLWLDSGSTAAEIMKGVIVVTTAAFVTWGGVVAVQAGIAKGALLLSTAVTVAQNIQTAILAASTTALSVATGIMSGAQAALNLVMSLNPIALVIIAVAALVAGIIYAYNHCEVFRTAVDDLWKIMVSAFNTIVDVVGKALSKIGEYLVTLPEKLKAMAGDVGMSIINGIYNGISETAGKIYDKLRDIARGALDAAKEALGIKSPSVAFTLVGQSIGDGLIAGVNNSSNAVNDAVSSLVNIPTETGSMQMTTAPLMPLTTGGGSPSTSGSRTSERYDRSEDTRPVIIQLDGQVIARSTWAYLKRQNLQGSALGFA